METIPFALGPMEDGNSSVRSQAPGHGSESAESEFKFKAAARQLEVARLPLAVAHHDGSLLHRGISRWHDIISRPLLLCFGKRILQCVHHNSP